MKRRDPLHPVGERSETTRELTGWDATMDEAEAGDAGNGAGPWGADFTGGRPTPIEERPDAPDDIVPDRIERWPGQPADQDRDVTAQPSERPAVEIADFGWRNG